MRRRATWMNTDLFSCTLQFHFVRIVHLSVCTEWKRRKQREIHVGASQYVARFLQALRRVHHLVSLVLRRVLHLGKIVFCHERMPPIASPGIFHGGEGESLSSLFFFKKHSSCDAKRVDIWYFFYIKKMYTPIQFDTLKICLKSHLLRRLFPLTYGWIELIFDYFADMNLVFFLFYL